MSHRISSYNRNIIKLSWIRNPMSFNLFSYIINQLIPNLQAQTQILRKQRWKSKQQPTKSTSDINYGHIFFQFILSWMIIKRRMLYGVAIYFEIVLFCSILVKCWIVRFPVYISMVGWEGKWSCVERVNMGSHTIFCFLRHNTLYFNLLFLQLLLYFISFTVTLWSITLHFIYSHKEQRD